MFESIIQFFKKLGKSKPETNNTSKDTAKERLHLVLMQDRANVSADFLDLMKQEIIEVIKKYIDVDENAIDVRLANKTNADGTTGAPALYANIPIVSIKNEERHLDGSVPEKKKQEDKKLEENNEAEKKEKQEPKEQAEKQEETLPTEEKKEDEKAENKEKNKEENTEKDTTIQEEKDSKEEEQKQEESKEKEEEKNSESVEAVTSTNSD